MCGEVFKVNEYLLLPFHCCVLPPHFCPSSGNLCSLMADCRVVTLHNRPGFCLNSLFANALSHSLSFDSPVWEQVQKARDKDRETEEMQKVEITSLGMICMLQTLIYYSMEKWLLLCLLFPRHSPCAGFPHGSPHSESGAQVTGS